MLKKYFKILSIEYFVFSWLIFFIIFTPNSYYFSFDKKRIFEVFIIFINLIILVNNNFRCRLINNFHLFSLTTRICLLFLLVLAVASSIYAPLIRSAFLEISLYLGLFLIIMTVFCLSLKDGKLFNNIFIVVLIASSVIYQTNLFGLYLSALIQKVPVHWPVLFTGFDNVRFFNQYQVWLFYLISYPLLGFTEMDYRLRNSLKVIAIGWAILLFYSGSRGALIAVFSGLLISGFIFKQQALGFIKLNLVLLFSGTMGAWFLFKLLPLFFGAEVTSGWRTLDQLVTDTPRLYLFKLALSYIKAHPGLGIGPMHYAYYPNPISSYNPNLIFAHPHNSLLQWAAEMGLPSTILLLTLVVHGLFLWIKRFKSLNKNSTTVSEDSYLWVVLFSTVCSAFIYSLVDGVIVMPTSQLLMATIIGWMFGLYFQSDKKNIQAKENLFVLIFSGMLLITLTYTIIPGLIPRLIGATNFSTREHPKKDAPRFWGQGHIPD